MTTFLALLSGLLLVFSFPRFGHPAFAWIALSPLIVATSIDAARGPRLWRRPFILGWLTGVVAFWGTLYWIGGVMAQFGEMPAGLAWLLSALLMCYLAAYPGLFAVLVAQAVRRFGPRGVWLAPWFWLATEWLRGTYGSGFQWLPLGASQATVIPVAQLASVTGVFGLTVLVALVSAGAAAVAISRRPSHVFGLAGVLLFVAVVAGVGGFRVAAGHLVQTGRVLRVGLLQGNVSQDVKWDPTMRDEILRRYIALSRQTIGSGASLVIWPEASMPFFFDSESVLAEPIRRLAAESRTPFLLGTDELDAGPPGVPARLFNSAVLVGADGRSRATYRKMRLVPFGEYVPFSRVLFFVKHMVAGVSDFTPGTEPVVFDIDGARVSVSICYESVYPSISRAFVDRGSELLATITNDAWFGRSSAAYQHFDQGALRAIEEGRFVVRAANTGISGAVDPYGRALLKTAMFEPAAVTVDVRLLAGRTIYNRLGDVVVWLALGVTLLFVLTRRRGIVRDSG